MRLRVRAGRAGAVPRDPASRRVRFTGSADESLAPRRGARTGPDGRRVAPRGRRSAQRVL